MRGRSTTVLIRYVKSWTERKHGGFYLTQFLSGYGHQQLYRHKMERGLPPDCLCCSGVVNDAEHTFFKCKRLITKKASLMAEIDVIASRNNIDGSMPGTV